MKHRKLTYYEVVVSIHCHLRQSESKFQHAYVNHLFFEMIPANERLVTIYNLGKPMEDIFSEKQDMTYPDEYLDMLILQVRKCIRCEYIDEATNKMYMDYLEYIKGKNKR